MNPAAGQPASLPARLLQFLSWSKYDAFLADNASGCMYSPNYFPG